jgi:hypothetical protein
MTARSLAGTFVVAAVIGAITPVLTHALTVQKAAMTQRANGTFEVTITPQASDTAEGGSALARLSIDKQFHGDLEGTSKGEMLSAGGSVKDSAGYVAIERVTGTLHGKKGSFVLQHSGTMNRGTPSLTVTVVPDSGTGDLVGLSGSMTIDIGGGKHAYAFEYAFGPGL